MTGRAILRLAPLLLKFLSVVGTAAMFIVGGGILAHGLPSLGHLFHDWSHAAHSIPVAGPVLSTLIQLLLDGGFGFLVGLALVGIVTVVVRMLGSRRKAHDHP